LATVAVRIPRHAVARRLLEACRRPLAAPSANLSCRISPTAAAHVAAEFGAALEFILDGGECEVGLESTVITLAETPPRLLRPGAVTLEQLRAALGEVLYRPAAESDDARPLSPGQLRKHYAPKTPLIFRGALDISAYPERTGLISFRSQNTLDDRFNYAAVTTLTVTGDLKKVAARLFAALREMDQLGLDLIVVDRCAEKGLGLAIMDRLRRAAAQ